MKTGKDAKSDRLFGWFPGKRFLRFPIMAAKNEAGQGCPLPLEDRVMFAYLAARTADGESTSLSEIARETGLNRTSAVINARDRLLDLGLLYYRKQQNIALEPAGWVREFFRFPEKLAGAAGWWSRYQYCWYVPAAKSLPVTSQAVHWLLWSYSDGNTVRVCLEGLAVQLGVTAKTIKRSLSPLTDAGLIRLYTDGKLTAGFLRPSVETLEKFPNRSEPDIASAEAENHRAEQPGVVYPGNVRAEPHRVGKDAVETDPRPEDARDLAEIRHKAISAAMKGVKLTEEEVTVVNNLDDRGFAPGDMRACIDMYRHLGKVRFTSLFNEASRDHFRNTGDERRGDCFALFRWKVRNHLGGQGTLS
jgi:hypothetical protein